MAIDLGLFDAAPFGGASPTPSQLKAMASMAAAWRSSGRKMVMNEIGEVLGIPHGGWAHGLSRLFVANDVRLVGLLRRFLNDGYCSLASRNLSYARRWVDTDMMLALCTAARESRKAVGASGSGSIETFHDGGLDFLWKNKEKLGLPRAITDRWKPVEEFVSPETGHVVQPAEIPETDQLLAYSAQINASYRRNFADSVRKFVSPDTGVLDQVGRAALMVWKALAFLGPVGHEYDPSKTIAAQSGHGLGQATVVGFVSHRRKGLSAPEILEGIISEKELNQVERVRIAKARTAEALFLERLWITSNELIPF
jgi:hypothetical protein